VNPSAGDSWIDGGDIFWESGPVDGGWIEYLGGETHIFIFPAPLAGHIPYAYWAWVSTSQFPQDPLDGGPQVEAAGQLAEFSGVNPFALSVLNATCSKYYLRVVAVAHLTEEVDAGGEAGPDAAPEANAPDVIAEAASDSSPDSADGAD
jgi:hypothetical protein